ncbi:FAD-binding oxidoreductase [Aquabacterium sp.]|uniref:FAD-binding oxidoreductase n=1 Tax=Aquabacterium sp. TaxID=1872578 RepID=UPI00344EA7BC
MVMPIAPDILARLHAIVGESHVKTDADSLKHWGCDWTKVRTPAPSAIVFPSTTEEVQAIVRLANELRLALVPSGGRTGLSGAAVAAQGEVVVSFDRMNRIIEFFPEDRLVRLQPGVVTAQLQAFAEEQGLYYPVDFASSGSSQLGGNIGTNAGGIKVIKYGMTRNWVLGLKVVTGKGDVLDLNKGMVKNATGYDLRQLFIGAEGTLGFVVEAMLKLDRAPRDLRVMVLGTVDFDAVMKVLAAFQKQLDLTAFEFFSELSVQLVTQHQSVPRPFEAATPFYALLEFEASSEKVVDEAMALFESCVEQGWVVDGVMSQNQTQAKSLWRLREGISETISHYTPYKNDLSVLIQHVPAFMAEIDGIVAKQYPDFRVVWFGHIGDGNVHLNILKPDDMAKDDFFAKCATVNTQIFETVARYDGSVSAEHGVGLTKKPYLGYSRSPEELAYMKAVKLVFDPHNVMNPGKVFDL